MKRILGYLAVFCMVPAVIACSDEGGAIVESATGFRITTANTVFEAAGGEGSIAFISEAPVEATTSASWLQLSVNEDSVTLTASANTSLQSRYARITLISDGNSLYLSAQQMGQRSPEPESREDFFKVQKDWKIAYMGEIEYDGEIVSLFDISGTNGKFHFNVVSAEDFGNLYDDSWAAFIDASAAEVLDWCASNNATPADIYAESDGQFNWDVLAPGSYAAVLYGVDENFTPTGNYNFCLFSVSTSGGGEEHPSVFTENTDWKIVYNGRSLKDGIEYEHISYKVPTGTVFYPYLMSKSEFHTRFSSDVATFANQLAAYLAQQQTALMHGPQEIKHAHKNNGDYVAIALGLRDDYTPTGEYRMLNFSIEDEPVAEEAYSKWLGTWAAVGRNAAGTADSIYFDITIARQLTNRTFAINGWGGTSYKGFGNLLTEFDSESGEMRISTFYMATGLDLENDNHDWVVGMYCFISHNGKEVPVGGDYLIAEAKLSADGKTATVSGNEMMLKDGTSYAPLYMWWAAFSDDDRYTTYIGKAPSFPVTLRKK